LARVRKRVGEWCAGCGAAVHPMFPAPVLFVDHAPACGGAEHCLLLLCEHLDRRRFIPHLACPPGDLARAARATGTSVHELRLARLWGQPTALWRFARGVAALVAIIRRARVALVHTHSVRASVYAAAAARLTGRPLVWHVHEILTSRLYTRALCRLADVAIAVSTTAAAPLPCTRKVQVIYNGVQLADFEGNRTAAAARLRAAWGVPPGAVAVGQVARLQAWKGQHDTIALAESVLQRFPDTYFLIVGGDIFGDAKAYEEELRATVQRRGLSARVIFTGQQSDIVATLHALDILVHPSRNEPFGRVLIEAGAAGIPVVAYADGGVMEAVVHEQTGLLARPGDRSALAAALVRLLSDHALARTLGAAARERVRSRFDVQKLTREIEATFERVMDPVTGRPQG